MKESIVEMLRRNEEEKLALAKTADHNKHISDVAEKKYEEIRAKFKVAEEIMSVQVTKLMLENGKLRNLIKQTIDNAKLDVYNCPVCGHAETMEEFDFVWLLREGMRAIYREPLAEPEKFGPATGY